MCHSTRSTLVGLIVEHVQQELLHSRSHVENLSLEKEQLEVLEDQSRSSASELRDSVPDQFKQCLG